MSDQPALVYIVAGEASGDVLGARLMRAMRNQRDGLTFAGIGGARSRGSKACSPCRNSR
jgi:lipid A disaccharide synthetase